MIDRGILTPEDPVELLEGWLIQKMPKNPPHITSTECSRTAIEQRLPAGWFINSQQPITLADSEPEPDHSLMEGQRRDFASRRIRAENTRLVVEVADSTLKRDRGTKKRIYASAPIPIYWIVNLIDKQVEVYSDPTGPTPRPDYRKCEIYKGKASVPLVLRGKTVARIPVNELLP